MTGASQASKLPGAARKPGSESRRPHQFNHTLTRKQNPAILDDKMERMNEENREGVMRTLEKPDTPILEGYRASTVLQIATPPRLRSTSSGSTRFGE